MRWRTKICTICCLVLFLGTHAQTRIINFNAIALGDSVRLNFTVTQGAQCSGYEIHRSSDSVTFMPIYNYPGLCGNTTYNATYTYTDFSPNKLAPNYYKIHIPPADYSNVLRVDLAASFTSLLVYPQPVENILNIAIKDQKNYYFEINIYDRFGRKKGFGSGNAVDKIVMDISTFAEGVYVFYIVQGNGNAYRGKFLKTPNKS